MENEQEEKVSADYLKGFNEGYTMTEHLPELADQISKAVGQEERGQGFQDGREQLLLEKTKERLISKSVTPDKSQEKDHSRGFEPGD